MDYARLFPNLFRISAFIAVCTLPFFLAATHADDKHVALTGDFTDDLYLSGDSVAVNAHVDGDVIAAGGRVSIDDHITQDVAAAAGQVEISGQVDDDVRAAGGQVRLNGRILGDAIAAGGHVWLTRGAQVGGRAWFAGGTVEVEGGVAGELRAAGNEVILAGPVDGDVRVYARTLKVLPGARIAGRLDYYSPTRTSIPPEAQLGTVTYHPLEESDDDTGRRSGLVLMIYFVLAITGMVLYLIFPRFGLGAARAGGRRPGVSLGLGLAALFAIPPVATLLMMTLVGLVLGALLFGFYALLLLAGFLTALLFVGDRLLLRLHHGENVRYSKRLLSLIAALLILWLIGFVPLIGGLAVFLLVVFGMGAVILQGWRVYKYKYQRTDL
jgi:cytoskeletal protein CcmA (bactofilin family)